MATSTSPTPKPMGSTHRLLWEPKLMYALNSAWGSTTANYLPVYYQHTAGFSKMQIGLLQTLPSIAAILGGPFWGGVADRIRNQRLVHVFCIVSGTLLQFSTRYFYWSLGWTVFMVLASQIQSCPAGSLLDHTVLNLLAKEGGEYGRQRLFGAVGWGIGTYLTGVVVALGGIFWSFNLCLVVGLSTLLVLRLIPPVKYGDEYTALEVGHEDGQGGADAAAPSFMETARLISQKLDVLVLLGVVFIMGNMHGVFTSFLQLNLYNLAGDDPHIIGVAIMCETSSELPAFFFADKIIKKIGTVNVLLVSLVGYTLRIGYYALMTNAWGAIPFEFLHGITFGLTWAVCTEYVFSAAPRGCEGTVMGVLSAVQNGLARASGTLIGGYFYENYGARVMWIATGFGVPLSLISVALFAYLKVEEEVDVEEEEELLQERAALFSPHRGDPQGLKSPMHQQGLKSSVHLTYDSVQ